MQTKHCSLECDTTAGVKKIYFTLSRTFLPTPYCSAHLRMHPTLMELIQHDLVWVIGLANSKGFLCVCVQSRTYSLSVGGLTEIQQYDKKKLCFAQVGAAYSSGNFHKESSVPPCKIPPIKALWYCSPSSMSVQFIFIYQNLQHS